MTGKLLQDVIFTLLPFANFIRKYDSKPMLNRSDTILGIHTGTEWEAEIKFSDCRKAAEMVELLSSNLQPSAPRIRVIHKYDETQLQLFTEYCTYDFDGVGHGPEGATIIRGRGFSIAKLLGIECEIVGTPPSIKGD